MKRKKNISFIVKANFVVVLSLLLFAGSALSRPVLDAEATIAFGANGTTEGGEFIVNVVDINNNTFDFIGFCLELNESIAKDTYRIDTIVDYAAKGGTGGQNDPAFPERDYLSEQSKWVYWEYVTGGFGTLTDPALLDDLADNVQQTIWALEDEEDSRYYDKATFETSQFYLDVVNRTDWNITGDVYVLNIGEYDDQEVWIHKQSIIVGEPVPEPTTMLLFATGLIGLAGVSYRRKNK